MDLHFITLIGAMTIATEQFYRIFTATIGLYAHQWHFEIVNIVQTCDINWTFGEGVYITCQSAS